MKINARTAEQSINDSICNGVSTSTGTSAIAPRLVYVCEGVYSVKATISLLHNLKRKLELPDLDSIVITAVADPADMCLYEQAFRKKHKVSNILKVTCQQLLVQIDDT